MTREQARKIINSYDLAFCDINGKPYSPNELAEAFGMATEALEEKYPCGLCKYYEDKEDWGVCQYCPAEPKGSDGE